MDREKEKLNRIRREIDRLDLEILLSLRERMAWAIRSRRFKEKIEDEVREAALLERIRQYGLGLLEPDFTADIFRRVVRASKAEQAKERLLVAIQGERGAYSEMAALAMFGNGLAVPCPDFASVFESVRSGETDIGIVPVENSIGGAIAEVNRLLSEGDLYLTGEVLLPIRHCILMKEGGDYRRLRHVYSHPQALAQCRCFLQRHQIKGIPYHDTAGAARMLASSNEEHAGVIASELCARLYRLQVVMEEVADCSGNTTRFMLISREAFQGEGNKCSLVFSIGDRSGMLMDVLRLFAMERINLTRIESMPLPGEQIRYRFFMDFLGSAHDPKIAQTMRKLEGMVDECRLLGCYLRAEQT